MKKKQNRTEYSLEDYNTVARNAKLAAITLLESHFVVKPTYFELENDKIPKEKLYYEHDFFEFNYTPDHNVASATFRWRVLAKKGRRIDLDLKVNYLIIYEGVESLNTEAVEAFVRKVGKFATYPYFRAHASQVNWESGVKLPVLPVITT